MSSSILYQIKSKPGKTDAIVGGVKPLRMRLEGGTLDLVQQAGYITDPNVPSYSQNQATIHRRYYQDAIGAIKGKSTVAGVYRVDVYADRICFCIKLSSSLDQSKSKSSKADTEGYTKRIAGKTPKKMPARVRRTDLIYVVPFQRGMQLIAYGQITRSAGSKTDEPKISRIFTLGVSGDEHSTHVDVQLKLNDGIRHHDTYRVYH